MAKLPKLEHVKFVRKPNGRLYAYFNTGTATNGKPVRVALPAPSSPDFFDKYAALKAARTKRGGSEYTVAQFIDSYMKSADYLSKAAATQKLYRLQLDKLARELGHHAVNRVDPSHIRFVIENSPWGAATKNIFISVVGALYSWGRKQGKTTLRPVEDFDKFRIGQHEPWPEDILEAALKAESDLVRLAAHILYCTGLRIGDACALRWGDIRDGIITVTPAKTKRLGKTLYIPVASELKAELDRASKRGITIMADANMRPIKEDALRLALKNFTKALGVITVPHGLRKNAVNSLLESGCTVAEVASITGQTMQIIEHYAARVNNKKLAGAAMLKFEAKRRNER